MTIMLGGTNRTGAQIKAKRAPAEVSTAKDALEAFRRMNTYRDMAYQARQTAWGYSGGTYTMRKHYARYEAYSEVADEWEAVLGRWLHLQAAGVPQEEAA